MKKFLRFIVFFILFGQTSFGSESIEIGQKPEIVSGSVSLNQPEPQKGAKDAKKGVNEQPGQICQEVTLGFYFLEGGKLDFLNSQIPLDFYVWAIVPGSDTPSFEFLNSKNCTINKQNDEPWSGKDNFRYFGYRVYGLFEQDLDLKNFPFDAYDIGVIVEDTTKDATERKYIPDLKNSNLDKLFKISGWKVDGFEITSKVQKYSTNFGFPAESDSKNSYSRIEVKMHLVRDNLIIFVKVVTPVILFLLISLLGVFLPIDQISQRINLCVGALFSSVAYHVNIASGLPPVSYLTFVDKMMMGNYLLIFMNIFFCIAIFMANKNDYPNLERFLAKSIRIILPTIFVVTYAIFIKHFLFP